MNRLRLMAAVLAANAILAGCSNVNMHDSKDFDRHAFSQLSAPLEGGDFFWFDVKLTAEMPADNAAAEERRLSWLASWMAARSACGESYEVLQRRPFEFLEHNPARFDLRYKVRCAAPTVG